jgi:hypothetical protein
VAYTLGAHHTLSGGGQIAVASPVGLRIALSSIPAYVSATFSHPRAYPDLGFLTIGNADGWIAQVDLHTAAQLAIPFAVRPTLLGYDLVGTTVADIDELLGDVTDGSLAPWDRNAATWEQYTSATAVGPTSPAVVPWTYTVPVGKVLLVDLLRATKVRTAVATTATSTQCAVFVDAGVAIIAPIVDNVLNAHVEVQAASSMVLLAGSVIRGQYRNSDTGGSIAVELYAHGVLFDAM